MKVISLFCLLFFIMFTSSSFSEDVSVKKTVAEPVSIINLIATPEKYHGMKVQIIGFAVVEFEDTSIFLSKADAEYRIFKNAIWFQSSKKNWKEFKKFNGQYVLAEGVFDMNNLGHKSANSGTINEVDRFVSWRKWVSYEKSE